MMIGVLQRTISVGRKIIRLSPLVLVTTVVQAQPMEIIVDPNTTYQAIDGWGGHVYPQTLPYHENDSTYESRMLDELQTTHIRLRSVWYLLEAENDNQDPFDIDFEAIAASDTGLVHDELMLQQLLADRGIRLQFASWRFPYWMIGMPPDWRPGADEKPDLPLHLDDEYVESMLAYLLYARDKYGIVFDAISVANEPDISIYIGGLTPSRLLDLTLKLQARLKAAGYQTRFYTPDVAAADSIGRVYTSEFFELEGAQDASVAVAYHSYRREEDVIRWFGKLGPSLNLPVWVTEQSHTHLAVEDRFEWSHAMKNAVCLHDVLVDGNASLSLYWSYAMSSSGGLGLYVPETKSWAPAYDMLKHFYNYVPVGSKRIEATPAMIGEGLRSVAFLKPDGHTIALILVNDGPETIEVNVSGIDGSFKIEMASISTAESRFEAASTGPIIRIPPASVTTIEGHWGE